MLHLQHQISNHMTSNNELLRAQEKIASLITEVSSYYKVIIIIIIFLGGKIETI